MKFLITVAATAALTLALGGPGALCQDRYAALGNNPDCVCDAIQGYVDYVARAPARRVNAPIPAKYTERVLQDRCGASISSRSFKKLMRAIASYVYYCSQGAQRDCKRSAAYIQQFCPNIGSSPLPPAQPMTRKECFYQCKSECGRGPDPYGTMGRFAVDPQCVQRCSDRCNSLFPPVK